MKISPDFADALFRSLFSLIFLGLGAEHLFSDNLIRRLMPDWLPAPREVSVFCGVWLVGWGGMILVGWHLRLAALALGSFLVLVTFTIHLPGVIQPPNALPDDAVWLWEILQRSNLVKNLCLLGVCFHLLHHAPGRFSVQALRERRRRERAAGA